MKSADEIKKFFKSAAIDTNPKMDEAVLHKVLIANEKTTIPKSASIVPNIRRIIMKNQITKLAVAAVVITVVALGLFEFIDTGSTSSVVWAEVAQKVEASRGVIFRSKDVALDSQDGGPDHKMNYLSSTQSRRDSYKGDQIIKTFYDDFNTKAAVLIDHGHKSYVRMTFEKMKQDDFLTDPKSLVQRFLSHEHRELGQRTVEGVLCEGIETTDPAFLGADSPVDSLMARIWVSVETGYPVQFEIEVALTVGDNKKLHITSIADQFQWDMELEESMFKPDIPADYIDISP